MHNNTLSLIRYHRLKPTLAPVQFAWVLEQANGEYFMWLPDMICGKPMICSMAARHLQATSGHACVWYYTLDLMAMAKTHIRESGWSDTRV